MDPGATSVLDYIQAGGVIGMFVLLTWAFLTRRIVPGWTYDSMETDRNYFRDLAHKGTEIADRQMTVAEALYEKVGVMEVRRDVLEAAEQERTLHGRRGRERGT